MTAPYYADDQVTLYAGDAQAVLATLSDASVDCCVTSPPYYGLRDYEGHPDQLGLEATPAEYVARLVAVLAEVRRVLRPNGVCWLNLGDSYSTSGGHTAAPGRKAVGVPPKNLLGIPWRVAFALQDDGWVLRTDVIWAKPNPMPESVTDRPACTYEHVFLLAKRPRYWFDLDAIRVPHADGTAARYAQGFQQRTVEEHRRSKGAGYGSGGVWTQAEGGRNPGDVWVLPTQPTPWAHFATMPLALADKLVRSACPPGGIVLDPFAGSGTTGAAAARHGARFVGVDLVPGYLDMALRTRLAQGSLLAVVESLGGAS